LPYVFFQAEDGIRDFHVTGVQTCALPICARRDQVGRHDVGGLPVAEATVEREQGDQVPLGDHARGTTRGLDDDRADLVRGELLRDPKRDVQGSIGELGYYRRTIGMTTKEK